MRIVKHAIGAFCLLAALLLVALWVRSYWVTDWVECAWHTDDGEYAAINIEYWQSARGQLSWTQSVRGIHYRYFDQLLDTKEDKARIRAELGALVKARPAERPWSYRRVPARDPRPEQPWHGFERRTKGDLPSSQTRMRPVQTRPEELSLSGAPPVVWSRMIAIPFWLLLLLLAAPAGFWLRGLLRRRLSPHACPGCGYDLRASPERCPECGRSITAARGGLRKPCSSGDPPLPSVITGGRGSGAGAGRATDFTDSED